MFTSVAPSQQLRQRGRRQTVQAKSSRVNPERLLQILFGSFIIFIFYVEVTLFNQLDSTQDYTAQEFNQKSSRQSSSSSALSVSDNNDLPAHLKPIPPVLPIFNHIPDEENLIANTLKGQPTMAGVIALLQKSISEQHDANMKIMEEQVDGNYAIKNFYDLASKHFIPFDNAYRGKLLFPIRDDDSIFMSIAAFREHLLADTLAYAFSNAKHPEKLFIGAIVQNCFGKVSKDGTIDPSGTPCKSGARVIGKQKNGKDKIGKVDLPIDKNGIEDFCAMSDYKKYCTSGQIRVIYMHESESLGPAMARYYASKLWGGETYFVQTDSHLRFAVDWDEKYRNEIKLTKNYPKSILSSYPPGFEQKRFIPKRFNVTISDINNTVVESPGCRLCKCNTPPGEPNPMLRINLGTVRPFLYCSIMHYTRQSFYIVLTHTNKNVHFFHTILYFFLSSFSHTTEGNPVQLKSHLSPLVSFSLVQNSLRISHLTPSYHGRLWEKKFLFQCVHGQTDGICMHHEKI
ncbi:MAG: hypothetical protein ACI8RD_009492 [Bacillariaceae sp.]|jgi:hypothetical protein